MPKYKADNTFWEEAKKQRAQYLKERIEKIDDWIYWLDGVWGDVKYPIDSGLLHLRKFLEEIKEDFEEEN